MIPDKLNFSVLINKEKYRRTRLPTGPHLVPQPGSQLPLSGANHSTFLLSRQPVGGFGAVLCPYNPLRCTTLPPTTVIRALVLTMASGSTARMFCDSTARSASLPTSIEPRSFSTPRMRALLMV